MINILFRHDNPVFESRINYVLDFINHHPLADQKIRLTSFSENKICDLSLFYGEIGGPFDFKIPAHKFFFNEKLPDFEQLICNAFSFNSQFLYSVENTAQPKHHFLKGNIFQFDIIETIFFHISRFEEWHYAEGREDQHGRMDARQQVLVKNQLCRKPVVDDLIFCFLKAIGIDLQNQKTRYRITHDIDFIVRKNNIFHIVKSMAGAILKRLNIRAAFLIWQNRNEANPYDCFDWMLRKEKGIEKMIYFLTGGHSQFDNPYDLRLPVFKKAVTLSEERGYKIGIHPSYETWKDEQLFSAEMERLQSAIGEKIQLTRQHFLRFSFKDTPQIIQRLGLKEDSSLGYADRIGFRCGTGFAYHLYDFENEKAFNFLEVPLVFMDSALFAEAIFKPEQIRGIWDAFITANQFNTQVTFNFHNSRFFDAHINGIPLKELYGCLFS